MKVFLSADMEGTCGIVSWPETERNTPFDYSPMQQQMTPDAVLVDVEAAMEALGEITGQVMREEITNRIFERFCVGK